jgi:transposase InsO family protein
LEPKDEAFKHYKAFAEKQHGHSIKTLQLDNDGEYVKQNFSTFLETHSIVHQIAVPHTPQQNGVAECKNRVINDAIHAQLAEASLPKCLWADCAAHTVFTLNVISI